MLAVMTNIFPFMPAFAVLLTASTSANLWIVSG